MPIRGVPNEGANLEYPIGLSLFSCRCEKSVLKLRHWIKVSRTDFQARGDTAVLRTSLCSHHTSLLLSRKAQIRTRCVTSSHVSFCCPTSVSVSFLANPPAPSQLEDRREHRGGSVPECDSGGGACEGTLSPAMGGRNILTSPCFPNSSNISAALYLGKGLQPAQPAPGPCGTVICVLVLFPQLLFH